MLLSIVVLFIVCSTASSMHRSELRKKTAFIQVEAMWTTNHDSFITRSCSCSDHLHRKQHTNSRISFQSVWGSYCRQISFYLLESYILISNVTLFYEHIFTVSFHKIAELLFLIFSRQNDGLSQNTHDNNVDQYKIRKKYYGCWLRIELSIAQFWVRLLESHEMHWYSFAVCCSKAVDSMHVYRVFFFARS